MQMVAWASTPLVAIAADEPVEAKPWGVITNAIIKTPPVKPFVWGDAIDAFGKFSFRFANGATTEANAKSAA